MADWITRQIWPNSASTMRRNSDVPLTLCSDLASIPATSVHFGAFWSLLVCRERQPKSAGERLSDRVAVGALSSTFHEVRRRSRWAVFVPWAESGQVEGPSVVSGRRRIPLLRCRAAVVGTGMLLVSRGSAGVRAGRVRR